jgi:phage-related protein
MLSEEYETNELDLEGVDGGYRFGPTSSIAEKSIQCFFENITKTQITKMMTWLDKGTYGNLIFDSNPYVYYEVAPAERPEIEIYETTNGADTRTFAGTITIIFHIYKPHGVMTITSIASYNDLGTYKNEVLATTGLLTSAITPPNLFTNISDSTTVLIYNPGTEVSDCKVSIKGQSGDFIEISNLSLGGACTIVNMTHELTTTPNTNLVFDSKKGRVYFDTSPEQLAFSFHQLGYIRLLGCGNIKRDVVINYTNESQTITSPTDIFEDDMLGYYVFLHGSWRYIGVITNSKTATINAPMDATGQEVTQIVRMNRIQIVGTGDWNVSYIKFDCIPYVK